MDSSLPALSLPEQDLTSPPAIWLGTDRHFRWLHGLVCSVVVLNLADTVLTLGWLSAGRATEGNPVLRALATDQPMAFACVKTALVSMGLWLLWRFRSRPLAVVAVFVAFLAYFGLLLFHLHAMDLHLARRLFT